MLRLLALVVLTASGVAAQIPADSAFSSAQRLALAGDTQAALDRLADAPSPEARRLRARLALDLGRPHLAADALAEADTLDAHAQLLLGHARSALGDASGARMAYRYAHRADPGGPATAPLAAILARQRPAEAAALYRLLVTRDSMNPARHLALGQVLTRMDSVDAGREHLLRSWMLYPRGEAAVATLVETMEDDPGGQMSVLTQALERLPRSPRLWRLRGGAAMMLGDMQGAVDAYTSALAFDDSTAARLRDLGVARFYAGQTPEAVEVLAAAYARDSTDATTLRVYGFAAHAENQSDLALDLLARAADAVGRVPLAELYEQVARVEMDVLRDDDAIQSIALAEALAPEIDTIVLNRAALLQQMGRLDASERAYREFLERAPEADPALRALAQDRADAIETIRLNRIEADLRRRLNE